MAQAARDQNNVTTLLAVSSVDGVTPVVVYANPTTHRLLVDSASGSGTVTSVSVVSANGFSGSVATATTTPAITISTTITGILQGNGTAISAASTTGSGAVVLATSPTITTPVITQINDSSAKATLSLASTASAVNSVQIENSVTGQPPHIRPQGSDANIGLHIEPKGTGSYVVISDGTDATKRYRFDASGFTTGAVLTFAGAITTARVITFPDATATLLYNGGALGTPSSGTLTSCTGLPISTGVSGLGTGVATALGVAVGSAGAFVTFNGALGTPSSGTATNLTGTATGLTSGITNGLKSATTTVSVSAATAPTNGQVLTATSSTTATWQTPAAGGTDYSCRVYQTGVTALTTSWVSCAFAAENFDTDTMHDNATNNTRITFTTAGKYVIGGVVQVPNNTVVGARIRIDGTTVIAQQVQGNSGAGEAASVSTVYVVTAGQYAELQGYASTVNSSGDAQTNFWAYRIAA